MFCPTVLNFVLKFQNAPFPHNEVGKVLWYCFDLETGKGCGNFASALRRRSALETKSRNLMGCRQGASYRRRFKVKQVLVLEEKSWKKLFALWKTMPNKKISATEIIEQAASGEERFKREKDDFRKLLLTWISTPLTKFTEELPLLVKKKVCCAVRLGVDVRRRKALKYY